MRVCPRRDTKSQMIGAEFADRRVLIMGAAANDWGPLTDQLAAAGSRLVLVDSGIDSLHWMGSDYPDMVRTMDIAKPLRAGLRRLGGAWGNAPLHGLVNLWPLHHPDRIDRQISVLRCLLSSFAKPLVQGAGSVVTICPAASDTTDMARAALVPALTAAQAAVAPMLMRKGVRVNMVIEPEIAPGCALPHLFGFLGREASGLTGQVLRVGSIDPGV